MKTLSLTMSLFFVALVACFPLSGCSSDTSAKASAEAKAETDLTVEVLLKDKDLLHKEETRCNEMDPVDALKDPVCQNVAVAKTRSLNEDYLNKGPDSKKLGTLPQPQ